MDFKVNRASLFITRYYMPYMSTGLMVLYAQIRCQKRNTHISDGTSYLCRFGLANEQSDKTQIRPELNGLDKYILFQCQTSIRNVNPVFIWSFSLEGQFWFISKFQLRKLILFHNGVSFRNVSPVFRYEVSNQNDYPVSLLSFSSGCQSCFVTKFQSGRETRFQNTHIIT